MDRLDVMLGGRVAEEVVFGDSSTGAHDDLQHATDLARDMVARFGMSDSLGLAAHDAPRQAVFLDVPAPPRREYSEATAQAIDQEVRRLLDEARARVLTTLSERKTALETLARMLMEREVVDGAELRELLGAERQSIGAPGVSAVA